MANFIDKLFRDKLQHRQFSSEAGDWTAMNELLNSELGTPPPSTYSINWLFLTVASVLFSISIYAGITSNNELVENTQNSNSIDINKYNSLQEKTTTASIQSVKSSISYNEKKSATPLKADKNQQTEYQESSQAINTISAVLESNNELADKNEDKTSIGEENYSPSNSSSSSTNLKKSKNTAVSAVALLEKEESQNEVNKGENQVNSSNATSFYSSNENNSKSSLNASTNKLDKNENSYQSSFSSYDRNSFDTETLNQKEMLFLSSQSISSLENKSEKASLQELSNDSPKIAKVKLTKAKRDFPLQLSIAAFGEVSYIMKKIKGESEFQSLIETRNSKEKNIVSFGAGLEFQAKYKQFGFSTGIMQSNWGENIQYEEKYSSEWDVSSSTIIDTILGTDIVFEYDSAWSDIDSAIVYFIVDSSFVTVIDSIYTTTVYDSTETITEVGLAKQNGKTQISYWEIPLYFSYQFDLGDFYLSPGIGVTIGFLKITKGYYMAEDQLSLIPINTGYSVIRKTLFNGQINLGLGYKLGDKFSFEAMPVYRFNLSNIFQNPEMIQKYSSLSVQFKLRYYF